MHQGKIRRDRHGHGVRGPLLPPALPRFRNRRELFDADILNAYAPFQEHYFDQLSMLDIAVDIIPRMRLNTDFQAFPRDIVADGPVPLARLISAGVDRDGHATRARIVLFRMPIEQRVDSRLELNEVLTTIFRRLVAEYLNLTPDDLPL
ncbi:metallopeptidase family protein [Corynebacterium sp. ES2794-CONJ1]|uniref:metallopeptidase family protein n=1 Tax=unclassified Corynebacterium TaxID=2624378 RepID=UPI0021695975|nr:MULTISPECIES: metallopeptidase family protein [unclassified Corynebacterium]MCS4489492.1 metallopeptidase family protein [Corynebacterium sp. ES2775-CONJ]MCS4491497.1 metallopeptidase family protein [Corynebacterium sp. ES2715-CONJ3]MCS4531403.1 metallopeptidase family protein [Corynebacterium sp. ES2730-CONJ]MCU9518790.1 metallopeptidase family protein [Corynebacterium sp. ES2794-CONJ1]